MNHNDKFPVVLMIMLCTRCAMGGAEKRYARVFQMLVAQTSAQHKLLITRSMLELLQAAGILTQHDDHLIILDPPFRRRVPITWLRPMLWLLDVLWYVWQCGLVIHRQRPDIIHPLLTGVYLSLPAVLLHPKARRVMSAYSYEFESYRDRRIFGIPIGASIKRFAMQRCHVIDALSMLIRDDLVQRGIPTWKIKVTPCAFTDLSLCHPATERKKWVVFLHRFVGLKNPLTLADAMPKVIAQHPDVHFYFLGAGYLQAKLEERVQELDLADYVTIRYEPHPMSVLNESLIFVTLQDVSSYPNQSLLEAMACGNAVLATDVGETWRLVDETNGIRIPLSTMTPDAVADALINLMDDPKLSQYGKASRSRVLSEHTAERYFAYIADVYRNATHEI